MASREGIEMLRNTISSAREWFSGLTWDQRKFVHQTFSPDITYDAFANNIGSVGRAMSAHTWPSVPGWPSDNRLPRARVAKTKDAVLEIRTLNKFCLGRKSDGTLCLLQACQTQGIDDQGKTYARTEWVEQPTIDFPVVSGD